MACRSDGCAAGMSETLSETLEGALPGTAAVMQRLQNGRGCLSVSHWADTAGSCTLLPSQSPAWPARS